MHNHILSLIFIYLSGRLFFYEINNIISQKNIAWDVTTLRALYGLTIFLLSDSVGTFLVLYIAYLAMLIIDSKTHLGRIGSGYIYFAQMSLTILIIPWILSISTGKIIFLPNPLRIYHIINQESLNKILLISCGFFFTLKEGTIIIRLVLNRVKAVPHKTTGRHLKDEQEYERGKLIGILERTFIYFLILLNQIGAIAVIIALKSLARFNELDNKSFAEYFLIGSLLSLLVAAGPAIVVKYLLAYL